MAYRVVQQSFWTDEKTIDLYSCEDKYFMLYLLTNPQATQLGIYKLPIKLAAFQLGYSAEQVVVLLDRFQNTLKQIQYNKKTQEIAIANYLIYSIVKGGAPVIDCIKRDLDVVKDKGLLKFVAINLSSKTLKNQTLEIIYNLLKEKSSEKETNDNDNDNDNEVSGYDTLPDTPPDTPKKKSAPVFKPPTVEEVKAYCQQRKNSIDPERFVDYYISKGWVVGKAKMKDWKAAVRIWERNNALEKPQGKKEPSYRDLYDAPTTIEYL